MIIGQQDGYTHTNLILGKNGLLNNTLVKYTITYPKNCKKAQHPALYSKKFS
ncbi:hypothetical protein ADIS_0510 [Lunatimonas lonarensis]|uniref:Uncharacterized protein n=1 Tax=Lunatimonas lonarensis TaxID=1232681 RepID=R7ZXX1_9BACT|nr:hypothetical protein ADIS_0510 [Lunatimonas lonarensis]